ncbi:hypothetical protein [Isoptericola sp. NPDC057391]|uniref:hypothetical protein n=1 Tax=Isoptericola sp. NPDC057391 TaxID=3346117 RepID=UPI00363F9EF3
MPQFYISAVAFDPDNDHPLDKGLTEADYWHMLTGTRVQASPNPGGADWRTEQTALDGSRWLVLFDYDQGTAVPVTAWKVK